MNWYIRSGVQRATRGERRKLAWTSLFAAILLALFPAWSIHAHPLLSNSAGSPGGASTAQFTDSPGSYKLRAAANPSLNLGILGPLMPELANAPAPPWLKPGFRLVYSGGAATIQAGNPHLRGGSMAARTVGLWNQLALNGAAGITQYDVVAVEGGVAVITQSIYLQPDGPGGAPQLSTSSTILGAAGGTGDLWINPTILKKFKSPGKEITVTRMPFDLNGQQTPSIWIKTTNDKGYEVHVYDQSTGMLLHYSGSEEGVGGQTQMTGTLSEKRRLDPPWLDHYRLPAALLDGQFRYSGAIETSVLGSFPMPGLSLTVTVVPKEHGTSWANYEETVVQQGIQAIQGQTSMTEAASGPGQLTSLWLPPEDLQALKNGQVLDNDPVTQVITSAARRRGLIVISQVAPTQRLDFGYNTATGMLSFLNRTQAVGVATMQTHLQLRP